MGVFLSCPILGLVSYMVRSKVTVTLFFCFIFFAVSIATLQGPNCDTEAE